MNEQGSGSRVVAVVNLREYFRDALQPALAHQHVAIADQTQQYVVNVLTLFARSEALYDRTPEGARIKPLVLMLTEALQTPTESIDIDYHIAMGGRAYDTLAQSLGRGRRAVLGNVFAELAGKFQPLVDALNEISETACRHSQRDVLRLYELWVKTGSQRSRRLLQSLGVTATPGARGAFQH
ncbi:MAG: hypothetical protein ABIT36_05915 [Steroidobacteraceae bacterium]